MQLMKTHLLVPGKDETMCGRGIRNCTIDPTIVTCTHCRGYYNYNASKFLDALVKQRVDSLIWDIETWIGKVDPFPEKNNNQLRELETIIIAHKINGVINDRVV